MNAVRAKWKRAEELVIEAGDMDPGDAAIMFMIASVMSQKNFYNHVVKATLNGEAVEGFEQLQDLRNFRAIRSVAGKDFERFRDGFLDSPAFKKSVNDAIIRELTDMVHRLVLAVMLKEKVGDKFYDI